MQMNFTMEQEFEREVVIRVIGVGGGGGNAINRMVQSGMRGVEFIAMNTDNQVLNHSLAAHKINIGVKLTKGKGAGGVADRGQRAAEENRDEITNILKGADMVFITAGMGGGTGTGASPVVAEIAKGMGILTVAVVTKPFGFEGKHRMAQAEFGIASLKEHVDALLVIPNEKLKYLSEERITLKNAFVMADEVLRQGVQSISDIIRNPGEINLDFADITTIMKDVGPTHMGVGRASGKDKAKIAAELAISSPLLETSIEGAKGILVNLTVPSDFLLDDFDETVELVRNAAHPDAQIIMGFTYNDDLKDELVVTLIATGLDSSLTLPTPQRPAEPISTPATAPVTSTPPQSTGGAVVTEEKAVTEDVLTSTTTPADGEDDELDFRKILDIFGNRGKK